MKVKSHVKAGSCWLEEPERAELAELAGPLMKRPVPR